jgi:multidrug resistance efflux pump
VRADLTALSTKATGVVATIVVSDFQPVKSGDLLVQLRDDAFWGAECRQVEAAAVARERCAS